MKTLLHFTPRLVAITIFLLLCSSLMANNTVATVNHTQEQSAGTIIAELTLVLLIILTPLFTKKARSAVK